MESVTKIFKYLKYTINYSLHFSKNNIIKIFTDADYVSDKITPKSTSRFIIKIGDSPTTWFFKPQHCVSTSTAEAEYYSISECTKHVMWYKNLLNELIYYVKF